MKTGLKGIERGGQKARVKVGNDATQVLSLRRLSRVQKKSTVSEFYSLLQRSWNLCAAARATDNSSHRTGVFLSRFEIAEWIDTVLVPRPQIILQCCQRNLACRLAVEHQRAQICSPHCLVSNQSFFTFRVSSKAWFHHHSFVFAEYCHIPYCRVFSFGLPGSKLFWKDLELRLTVD